MPRKSDWELLPTDLQHIYDNLPLSWQGVWQALKKKHVHYGNLVTAQSIMRLVQIQSHNREPYIPYCAGAGHRIKPAGLNAPEILRIDRDEGYDPENLVLITKAYYRLRQLNRDNGPAAHARIRQWLIDAGEFYRLNPTWDISDLPEEA